MQILKNNINERILRVAYLQFVKKGYMKTSMRDVAAAAGVSIGNIYNYFTNKDELFRTIVSPVITQLDSLLCLHHGHNGMDVMEMISENYILENIKSILSLIRTNHSLLKILLFRAQGSSLEDFKKKFSDHATLLVKKWFTENK